MAAKFELGRTVITRNALNTLCYEDIQVAMGRHAENDWGELCDDDKRENDGAVIHGFRILSSYRDRNGNKFWIVTEADRSATTVLLPEDY